MTHLVLPLLLTTLLLACTTGCSSLAQVAKQLKDDPAFVTVHVRTLYGSGFLVRDGRAANGNSVTPEGGVQSTQPVVVTNVVAAPPPVVSGLVPMTPTSGVRPIPPRSRRTQPNP